MSDRHPEWQAIEFNGQILGAYKLPGGTWKYLRKDCERQTFPTKKAATDAARQRALDILFPEMRSSKEPTDAEVADKLGLSDWIRSKREDKKKQTTVRTPGKRPYEVIPGRS